jgi:hypothetical protein
VNCYGLVMERASCAWSKIEPRDRSIYYTHHDEPGSSVGTATEYGLDGPGIESRWGRDFSHRSRPALGHTQPPVKGYWEFPGVKQPGRGSDHPPSYSFT